jgi:hypothetical protein
MNAAPTRRLRACVEAWPECREGGYDPRCCRFPKSCSATVYDPQYVTEADLEPPAPTPTNEQQDARGEHIVTVEFEEGYGQHVRMTCHAPADSMCHAEFDCECELWWNTGVEDGRPWHATDYDNPDAERHYGKFTPDFCNLREWFSNSDDPMSGSVSFPVEASFEGDYYSFKPTPLAAVSAAAPEPCPECGPGYRYGDDGCRHAPAAAPDEREALTCRTFDERGESVCDRPARYIVWGHLFEKRDKGPKCGRHLPQTHDAPWSLVQSAIYEIPALAARPAPVVSGADVERLAWRLINERYSQTRQSITRAILDFIDHAGITVADAPAADDEGGQER